MRIRVWVRTNVVGSTVETSFEVKPEELAEEAKNDLLDWNWEKQDA